MSANDIHRQAEGVSGCFQPIELAKVCISADVRVVRIYGHSTRGQGDIKHSICCHFIGEVARIVTYIVREEAIGSREIA
jgi:hypothetical protein